jgi:hypothetical protein
METPRKCRVFGYDACSFGIPCCANSYLTLQNVVSLRYAYLFVSGHCSLELIKLVGCLQSVNWTEEKCYLNSYALNVKTKLLICLPCNSWSIITILQSICYRSPDAGLFTLAYHCFLQFNEITRNPNYLL